jgi:hypothetical protein
MTRAEETIKIHTTDFGFVMIDAMSIHVQEFLDSIRDYERESGKRICDDERTSEELYDLFNNQNK